MGVEARNRPPLPAPTESTILNQSGDEGAVTDLATDISRRTDRTSYSIPEDGSPVTINTNKKSNKISKSVNSIGQPSQTSLLIEYFEADKGPNVTSRPSVRVKVTPSSTRKGKNAKDHIQITEGGSGRRPSYTRRISLGPKNTRETYVEGDDRSVISGLGDSSIEVGRAPVDIEVIHRDQDSDLSARSAARENEYLPINPSEVSSMPPDIMIESEPAPLTPTRTRSRSIIREDAELIPEALNTPSRQRSRSLSRERLTKKVIEKLGKEPMRVSGGKHRSSKSRSRSVSKEQITETISSPRRKSGRHHRSEDLPSTDPSLLTASQLSDGRSFRSGTSKSSINNPKLLETVEDAIRRLILPELTALKHEQKTQRNREKFETGRRDSVASGSSLSREESSKRVSKYSSDPNVRSKSKGVVENDPNMKKSRRGAAYDYPPDRTFERGMSEETVIRDEGKLSRKGSKDRHRVIDAAAGALIGGVLTREALKHHDSKSSMERRERRRKRSKSHSRGNSQSASIAGTEEIFEKHDVPPMPMRSEVTGSDITRDSILSERTSTPLSDTQRAEIRQVVRGSPRRVSSRNSPSARSPGGLRSLGTYHENESPKNEFIRSDKEENYRDRDHHYGEGAVAAAGIAGAAALAHHAMNKQYNVLENDNAYTHGRDLSPIQSVASFEERDVANQRDLGHPHSTGELSLDEDGNKHPKYSTRSLSSTENVRERNRPRAISLEGPDEILAPHEFPDSDQGTSRDPNTDSWYDQEHEKNEYYRGSSGDSYEGSKVDVKHLTNFTDDSMDAPYLDKVTAAQQIRGIGANPEYIHTPVAVESAVASLYEPSALDVRSTNSGRSKLGETYLESPESGSQLGEFTRELHEHSENVGDIGSPLKNQVIMGEQETNVQPRRLYNTNIATDSPRQSAARSIEHYDEEHIPTMTSSAVPDPNSPIPEIGRGLESKSDISTNPSIIRGPGALDQNTTPWNYAQNTSTQRSREAMRSQNNSAHDSLKAVAKNMLNVAAGAGVGAALASRDHKGNEIQDYETSRDLQNDDFGTKDDYRQDDLGDYEQGMYANGKGMATPQMQDGDGYRAEANEARSPALTPDYRAKGDELFRDADMDDIMVDNDPFSGPSHQRHLSGNSHGMPSPLYDSSTGRGMDRIQSRDVVALMDHLTVRDAQRNARDTEILVTLVRSAAEMRNSFEDMKRFIQEQDDMLVDVGNKQHEKTQRTIGGPRPQPLGTARVPRGSSEDVAEDLPTKRRNVFRRALRGLGGRSNNDLSKIEEMLNHLLDEVAELKSGEKTVPPTDVSNTNGLTSYENLRDMQQETLVPESGPNSTGDQSGYFSNSPSRQTSRPQGFAQRNSENRVSTVMEAEDENEGDDIPLEPHEQEVLEFQNTEHLLTPTRNMPRGGSVPLDTPPTAQLPTGTQSNENTPRMEKNKKHHKSSSSSFFPKISRWSKTTASSVADNVRQSTRRERPFSEVSRSGSDLQNYNVADHYDPQGDDRLQSQVSMDQARSPSPLIPSQVSGVSEKPTYRAHRDSLNLQHPQPTHGPTARYQNHLESQVQNYSSPVSPTSDQFGSNPVLARFSGGGANRHSGVGNLSPISDTGYSERSQTTPAPPRPPKLRDDGPLVPEKVPLDDRKPTFSERSAPGAAFSQVNGASGAYSPQRKPTGPRPIVSSGSYTPDRVAAQPRTRFRGSPNHVDSSSEDVTF